jgi:hypothetical protein
VPDATTAARKYLDLCAEANVYPDEKRTEREKAQHAAEQAICLALGVEP